MAQRLAQPKEQTAEETQACTHLPDQVPQGGEGSVSPLGELDERVLPCLLLMARSVEHPVMSTACHNKATEGMFPALGRGFRC